MTLPHRHLAPEAVRPAVAALFIRARELNVNPASLAPHFLPKPKK